MTTNKDTIICLCETWSTSEPCLNLATPSEHEIHHSPAIKEAERGRAKCGLATISNVAVTLREDKEFESQTELSLKWKNNWAN